MNEGKNKDQLEGRQGSLNVFFLFITTIFLAILLTHLCHSVCYNSIFSIFGCVFFCVTVSVLFKVSEEYTDFGTPSNILLTDNLVNLQPQSINVNAACSFYSGRKKKKLPFSIVHFRQWLWSGSKFPDKYCLKQCAQQETYTIYFTVRTDWYKDLFLPKPHSDCHFLFFSHNCVIFVLT